MWYIFCGDSPYNDENNADFKLHTYVQFTYIHTLHDI